MKCCKLYGVNKLFMYDYEYLLKNFKIAQTVTRFLVFKVGVSYL